MSKQEPEKRLRVQRVTRKLGPGGGISESASVVHFSLAFSIILASFQPNSHHARQAYTVYIGTYGTILLLVACVLERTVCCLP